MNLNFTFQSKAKTLTYIMIAIGIAALLYGYISDHDSYHTRTWSNLLINSYFFLGIAITGTFFIAVNYAAEAAWGIALKRIFEAIGTFIPYAALFILLVIGAGSMHWHHLYHWMDAALYNEYLSDGTLNSEYDAIIAGKSLYLNQPFFWIRTLIYLAGWILFTRAFRTRSLQEDLEGGTTIHYKNIGLAAGFLVFFAVTSSTSSWDWIMSIDTHWFSTLFGWYAFSGMWISGIIMIMFLVIYLKNIGYLEFVNDSHIHDLGKWMFAVSFLWCYLWFSQFMLIWYSDIPEEVTYFVTRIKYYKGIYFMTFIINLIFPMLILMSRDSKRKSGYLLLVGIVIFIGHWLDTFLLVAPGALDSHWHIGFVEIGIFIGFLGLFLFVVLRALTKAPLLVRNHPYLEETLHHNI